MNLLIADDEAPARRKVKQFLQLYNPDLFCEEADSGLVAIEKIKNNAPDLVLLDIQMPHFTGMEVVHQIGVQLMPPVIFLTAYQEYAIQAFEIHAIDYLLKPFDFERFQQAMDRAIQQIEQDKNHAQLLQKITDAFPQSTSFKEHLWVQQNGRYIPLNVNEIPFFKADNVYIQCFFQGKSYLLRESLRNMENSLDPSKFVRTHRSYIVNLKFIKEIFAKSHGDCTIRLINGEEIPLSRRYRDKVFSN